MELQIDTRKYRIQEVRVGQDDQEVAIFRKASRFIQNPAGKFEGLDYQMKLAAPWNGFRFQLRQGDHELASAKRKRRMHAFDPDRPMVEHQLVEFDLDVQGRAYRMTPEDRFGLTMVLREGEQECARLAVREFEKQRGGPWEADLQAPDDWTVPLGAFVAWLSRESRRGMGV